MALRRILVAPALVVLFASCGGDGSRAATPSTVVPSTAASTSSSTSSSTSTTSTSTTTTVAPSTTEPLPVPAPAPEPHAPEPKVEVGGIEIPKIGMTKTMYEGVSLTVLDIGPGHWPGSAMPGHRGNVVVAGHRTSHDRPFRHIDQLVIGDEVVFTTPEGRFVYEVTGTEVVDPTAIRIIEQTDAYTATLFACHPPGSTKERIVVHLQLRQPTG
jgi:sortase A